MKIIFCLTPPSKSRVKKRRVKNIPAATLALLLSRAEPLVVDGVTLPNDSLYGYHDRAGGSTIVRHYLLQEQHPRTYLMCPQGFAIEKVRPGLVGMADDIPTSQVP